MLETFDNETEYGKLYIDYPMVESIRYTKFLPDANYWTYTISRTDCNRFKGLSAEFSAANSTSKCKITKCFCKSTPLVLRNSISFLVSH